MLNISSDRDFTSDQFNSSVSCSLKTQDLFCIPIPHCTCKMVWTAAKPSDKINFLIKKKICFAFVLTFEIKQRKPVLPHNLIVI